MTAEPILWVTRTWSDVVEGDIVRPAGRPDIGPSRVLEIGPAQQWHIDPKSNPRWPRPKLWRARRVVLDPDPGMPDGADPDGRIDIAMTRSELNAPEMLGGWAGRVRVEWRK